MFLALSFHYAAAKIIRVCAGALMIKFSIDLRTTSIFREGVDSFNYLHAIHLQGAGSENCDNVPAQWSLQIEGGRHY